MSLTEDALLAVAGDRVFARGEEYVRYVKGLRTTPTSAAASVQAKRVYTVEIDWSGPQPAGYCSCPHAVEGHFCKHMVAVALAVIDSGALDDAAEAADAIEATVRAMSVEELREFILNLAARSAEVRRTLEVRAASTSGDDAAAQQEFETHVVQTLELRGYVDYRGAFDVADDASRLLDELEAHMDAGSAEVVRPAVLRALTVLRDLMQYADDSSGAIGVECDRAAELYARACREGRPDPVALASWLVSFRASSPGWPELHLADFVDAFDEAALTSYREKVAALDDERYSRYQVDAMRLELADLDGDVDLAVELLAEGERPRYEWIVQRLRAAGRDDEAVNWIDRAVGAGRVTSRGNGFGLNPVDVAETYRARGRTDDAIAVLRADFAGPPTVRAYRALVDFAAGIGRDEVERSWAVDHARELASGYLEASVLVRLHLSDDDVEAAWEASDRHGPGDAWEELATRGAEVRPIAAADLYRPGLENDLRHANTRLYPGIANRLATMGELYEKGGRSAELAAFIARIREDYRRRTSLLRELDLKRL